MKRWISPLMIALAAVGCAPEGVDVDEDAESDLVDGPGETPANPGDEEAVGEAKQAIFVYDYSASDTNDALNEANVKKHMVNIAGGQTVMIGTTAFPGAVSNGDTYLRLFNFLDKQVAQNDDSVCTQGTGSLLWYTSPYGTTETFTIWGGCAGNESCGPNTVQVARRSSAIIEYSADNTNNAQQGTTNQIYNLQDNQNVRVTTCSFAGRGAQSTGDTFLRLFRKVGGDWVAVAANDDTNACASQCGTSSMIQYNVPADGQYQVRAGCFDNQACSGKAVLYTY